MSCALLILLGLGAVWPITGAGGYSIHTVVQQRSLSDLASWKRGLVQDPRGALGQMHEWLGHHNVKVVPTSSGAVCHYEGQWAGWRAAVKEQYAWDLATGMPDGSLQIVAWLATVAGNVENRIVMSHLPEANMLHVEVETRVPPWFVVPRSLVKMLVRQEVGAVLKLVNNDSQASPRLQQVHG